MLIFITGIASPLGFLPVDALTYERVTHFANGWTGRVFILIVVSLTLWHGVHRIFLSLHDFGIRKENWQRWLLYGFAALGTLMTGILLYLLPV